jgi:hypothetical protein
MVINTSRGTGFAPWAGLIAGMVGAGVQHQGITDALHYGCDLPARRADLGLGLAVMAAIAIGALVSWRALVRAQPDESTRRFAARLSLIGASLFGLMTLWMTLAGSIEPICRP